MPVATLVPAAAAALACTLLAGAALAQTPTPAPRPVQPAAPAAASEAPPSEAAATEAAADEAPAGIGAANDLSLGEVVEDDAAAPGSQYVAAEFGDWQMTCVRSGLEADPCELYQLLREANGNSIAEIRMIGLPPGSGEAVAGASIVTPLETYLPAQITLRVDAGQAKRYPFTVCTALGCIARVGFTEAEVQSFRRGNKATIVIVPAIAPDQQVAIEVSLRGFTAGFEAVNKANAAADAAAKAALASSGQRPAQRQSPAP